MIRATLRRADTLGKRGPAAIGSCGATRKRTVGERRLAAALVLALSAAPAAAQTQAPAAAPSGEAIEQVPSNQVVAVLGLAVKGDAGKEIGRIVDVLVDRTGAPRAAVIDVGGFLGMGSRKVAVEWPALRFVMGKAAAATLAIPSAMIKSAPAYDPAKPVEALGLPEVPPAAPHAAPAAPPQAN